MTISYTLDVSQTNLTSFLRLLFRWRGSLWKAVFSQLFVWTIIFLAISVIYRFILSENQQIAFESLAKYLNAGIDSHLPLTFMLGFFVSFVVGRWGSILNGLGWIDNSAICFATFIRGTDPETRMLRRTLIRYMVLNQTLVLRDISMQVRKRFPTLNTIVAAGILTSEELQMLNDINDPYSRYWTPIQWCYSLIYEARLHGKISSDHVLEKITNVPIPVLYPQLIFVAVRLYFLLCLIGRQFIIRHGSPHKAELDLWLPITTMIQFVVYVGWMKVAEALLNPLGEDDDDLECNYVIDKNLITGLTMVDQGGNKGPEPSRDMFWNDDHIAPLYSLDAAKRTVHPLVGSASRINLVEKEKHIVMIPHKSKLGYMGEETQEAHIRMVDVVEHNEEYKTFRRLQREANPDDVLSKVRRRHKRGGIHKTATVANTSSSTCSTQQPELWRGGKQPQTSLNNIYDPCVRTDGAASPINNNAAFDNNEVKHHHSQHIFRGSNNGTTPSLDPLTMRRGMSPPRYAPPSSNGDGTI